MFDVNIFEVFIEAFSSIVLTTEFFTGTQGNSLSLQMTGWSKDYLRQDYLVVRCGRKSYLWGRLKANLGSNHEKELVGSHLILQPPQRLL